MYPLTASKARKAEIKKQYLEYLERLAVDPMIPDPPEAPEVSRVREAIQGTWTMSATKAGERTFPGRPGSHWTIAGDRITTVEAGNSYEGKFRIDPRRTPAVIDCRVEKDPWTGQPLLLKGIFSVEGNILKVCWSSRYTNGGLRPRTFPGDNSPGTDSFVLKRDPKDKPTAKGR